MRDGVCLQTDPPFAFIFKLLALTAEGVQGSEVDGGF